VVSTLKVPRKFIKSNQFDFMLKMKFQVYHSTTIYNENVVGHTVAYYSNLEYPKTN
jgi:hypothetical protein